MNNLIKIITAALLFMAGKINAQEFQGIATYESKTKIEISLDSASIDSPLPLK